MLVILVYAVPPLLILLFGIRLRSSNIRARAELAKGFAERGWRATGEGEGRTVVVPIESREVTFETYYQRTAKSRYAVLGCRHVGIEGVGDLQIVPVHRYAAGEIRAGLAEVTTEPPFRAKFRAFAADASAFERTFRPAVQRAMVAFGLPIGISLEKGTLVAWTLDTDDLDLLDRFVAIVGAILGAEGRGTLRLRLEPRRTGSATVGCIVGAGALGAFLAGGIGAALVPLPDHAPGRAIATPVVCPNGGVPDVVHYSSGKGNSWNVQCVKKAESRTFREIRADGDYASCPAPNLTLGVLSFEVYAGLVILATALLAGAVGLAAKRNA